MMKIDPHTVKKLELMAPGVSRADARTVRGWVISGEVLGAFSETERSQMWERMQQFDSLIPSLHTFFRDMDYLESCADAVKRLFPLSKTHPTLWSAMSHYYARPAGSGDACLIQTSESRLDRRPGDGINHLELAYRQVWLYAMRHYPSMTKDPESNNLLTRPANEKADETVVYEMAVLAQKLGFTSPDIQEIINQSPDRQIAADCLLKARKPESYEYSADDFERLVRRIVECFAAATPREQSLPVTPLVTSAANRRARGGLPSRQAQKNDRRYLFIDHLHCAALAAEKVSTRFVRRSVYLAFFGRCFSPPLDVPVERTSRFADSASPLSPLFVPDDDNMGEIDPGIDDPLPDQRRLPREASAVAAEQERLQQQEAERRAAVAEQERLRKEAEERAAAEAAEEARQEAERAAEQERLRREEEERVAFAAEQERRRREAESVAAEAAEQERLQQEAIAAEQVRLRREAEERAAAEAAEQERLQREQEERVVAEQERLRWEAQERAAAETAEQERLQQEAIVAEQSRLQREAEEQAAEQERVRREAEECAAEEDRLEQEQKVAAEQERLRREAEERAAIETVEQERLRQEANAAEEERIAQERGIALAHLEQGDEDVSTPPDAGPLDRSSSTTHVDLPTGLPTLITRLREGSDSPDPDHSPIVEPHHIATQSFSPDRHPAAIESHTVEAPAGDGSPPRTATAGLAPITEEAEVSSPIQSVIIEGDHQRQLREHVAERRQADKEKVANSERAALEIDDHFTQTRSAEIEDLYINESDEEATAPSELPTDPTLAAVGASEILGPDRIQKADRAARAPTTEPLPPVTVTRTKSKPKPMGIQKARNSAIAPKKPRASRRSFDPSLPRKTQLDFQKIMADLPVWPGNDQSSSGDVGADSTATAEQAESPASGLARFWRRRAKPATQAAKSSSRRSKGSDAPPLPPPPSDLEADAMIFWVWKANQWREIERVALDPSDPLRAVRAALRYEQHEPVEFVDKNMHGIAAAKCVQVAQAEGTRSIFMLLKDGPLERPITRAMAMAADDVAKLTVLGRDRKRGR